MSSNRFRYHRVTSFLHGIQALKITSLWTVSGFGTRRKIQLIRLHIFVIPNSVGLYENINALQSNVSKTLLNYQELLGFRCIIYCLFYVFMVKKMIIWSILSLVFSKEGELPGRGPEEMQYLHHFVWFHNFIHWGSSSHVCKCGVLPTVCNILITFCFKCFFKIDFFPIFTSNLFLH